MNPGREQSALLNITVSSAVGTGTIATVWAITRWIRVHPPAESDTWTLQVKDALGNLILSRTDQVGTFSERVELSLGIARTIDISAASADGTYKAYFDMH